MILLIVGFRAEVVADIGGWRVRCRSEERGEGGKRVVKRRVSA